MRNPTGPHGAHTFIDRGQHLESVAKKFGRGTKDLCLKICDTFPIQEGQTLESYGWCGSPCPVLDCTKLQNIAHWEGLAPRVYAVDIVEYEGNKCVCQLQDYVGDGEGSNDPLFDKVRAVLKANGGDFKEPYGGTWNSAGGKWVGFKSAYFTDKDVYKKKIEHDFGCFLPEELPGVKDKVEYRRIPVLPHLLSAYRHMANYLGYFNIDYESEA